MKKLSLVPKLTLAAALMAGALAIPAPTRALSGPPPVACPENYSPVICSNGQIYSNSCFAAAAGATGCVSYGGDI